MTESRYVGAYWGNRKETAASCARRLETLLDQLSECDPALSKWYEKGSSASQLRKAVLAERDSLATLLERGRSRRDSDRTVIEDLGFRASIWNGSADCEADLTVNCGGYASTPSTWLPNSCVLNLPSDPPAIERMENLAVLTRIIQAFATALEPSWAVVSSDEYWDLVSADSARPPVGWLTYVATRPDQLPPLPGGVAVVPSTSGGSIIITTNFTFSVQNPEHLGIAEQIRDALDGAGLLRKTA